MTAAEAFVLISHSEANSYYENHRDAEKEKV